MVSLLLFMLFLLSVVYILKLIKLKFNYQDDKDILVTQIILFSLSIILILTGYWFACFIIVTLIFIISPKKFGKFIRNILKK